ncbi:hypothetical protein Clacol_007848 [Clathrus columnatus]|uniref:Uncharacterized protein n=1 Tax=Clathrus columnatus TaxID=1419009 RepID=A0AAV5AG19_9AGAM|nr:hypothetical protein Clacol_007848 [Clathrus columnatus]
MSLAANVEPSNIPELPPGTSLAGNLQGTFGLVVVAVIISAFLTGILTLQTYTYYSSFPKDSLFRKIMVALIYLLDFGQFYCITDYTWWYLRIWALDGKLRYLCTPIIFLIALEFAFGIIGGNLGIRVRPFAAISTHGFNAAVVAIWLGSGVAADVALAAALSYILQTSRTGIHRTDNLITKLMIWSVTSYNRRATLRIQEASDIITTTGIVVRTDRTTDANDVDLRSSSPGQESTLVPTRTEPKPSSDVQNDGSSD